MAERLTDDVINAAVGERLPEWQREGDAIVREYTFDSFPDAIAFVTRVADRAAAASPTWPSNSPASSTSAPVPLRGKRISGEFRRKSSYLASLIASLIMC